MALLIVEFALYALVGMACFALFYLCVDWFEKI